MGLLFTVNLCYLFCLNILIFPICVYYLFKINFFNSYNHNSKHFVSIYKITC